MRQSVLAWFVDVDGPATSAAYRRIKDGAARLCGCVACRNFDAARPVHYPDELLGLLKMLGIDPHKEASVRLVSPLEGHRHLYTGTYGFCGSILSGRPFRGFPVVVEEVDVFESLGGDAQVAIHPWIRPPPPWLDPGSVRLEFLVVLPWVMETAAAPAATSDWGPGDVT